MEHRKRRSQTGRIDAHHAAGAARVWHRQPQLWRQGCADFCGAVAAGALHQARGAGGLSQHRALRRQHRRRAGRKPDLLSQERGCADLARSAHARGDSAEPGQAHRRAWPQCRAAIGAPTPAGVVEGARPSGTHARARCRDGTRCAIARPSAVSRAASDRHAARAGPQHAGDPQHHRPAHADHHGTRARPIPAHAQRRGPDQRQRAAARRIHHGGARAHRLGRLAQREDRRTGQRHAGAPLAGLHAQALHLRARARSGTAASQDRAQGRAHRVRPVSAREFRPPLCRPRVRAGRTDPQPQHPRSLRRIAARQAQSLPVSAPGGRAENAERIALRTRAGAGRWRGHARRTCRPLRHAGQWRHRAAGPLHATRQGQQRRPAQHRRAASADQRRGRLHHARHAAPHAAPGHRTARAPRRRVENRHVMGLPRCVDRWRFRALRARRVDGQFRRQQQPRAHRRGCRRAPVHAHGGRAARTALRHQGSAQTTTRQPAPDRSLRGHRRPARCAVPRAHQHLVHRGQVAHPDQPAAPRRVGR